MRRWELASDAVRLAVTEVGAMLDGVVFDLGGREVAPMHVAPWADEGQALGGQVLEGPTFEDHADDVPPMLRTLRGDFLAAPFGDSDVIPDEPRAHGRTANGDWTEVERGAGRVELELDGTVMGARVRRSVEVRPGEAVVYQREAFTGGSGRLPLGHHAMLRAPSALRLSFAPWRWAATPPAPVEVPPQGRSALRYPQRLDDLTRAELADGGTTDLTRYPTLEGHEDLWMLVAQEGLRLGWTAAVCEAEGWVWFALKDPRVLPATVVWRSNGGRDYPPFSGRHRGVIGLEEVCAYFHLGHRASLEPNEVADLGVPTAVRLTPERPFVLSYLFGVAAVPPGFGAVREVRVRGRDGATAAGDAGPAPGGGAAASDDGATSIGGGVTLIGDDGARVDVACDPSFVLGGAAPG